MVCIKYRVGNVKVIDSVPNSKTAWYVMKNGNSRSVVIGPFRNIKIKLDVKNLEDTNNTNR